MLIHGFAPERVWFRTPIYGQRLPHDAEARCEVITDTNVVYKFLGIGRYPDLAVADVQAQLARFASLHHVTLQIL